MKQIFVLSAIAVTLALAPPAPGQSLGNLGLVGVGRVSSASFDQLGPFVDSLGGVFSGMTLNPLSLSRSGDTYSGTLYGLSDRGFGGGVLGGTFDFHPRVQTFNLALIPYYGPGPTTQDQISLVNSATTLWTVGGVNFTGANASDGTVDTHPQSTLSSAGHGHWSLDPEGLARTSDGGYYVSDEYGPFIYRFNSSGELQDVLTPPIAFIPKKGSAYPRTNNFGATIVAATDSGRFVNRGLEGLSLTPDEKKLVALLQSPLAQDGQNQNGSRNTRILVFDIDPVSATYNQPVGEYVYQLTLNGNEAGNRSTPVSALLALNDHQFLVLERDSRGLGGDDGAILYKRVIVADISGASNILNTGYDLEKGAPGQLSLPLASLPVGLVPATHDELVNILDPAQLARFVLNTSTNRDTNTLAEKWESLALLPLNDPTAPNDFLLLVGNDNDFLAPVVYVNGVSVFTNTITSDSIVLAYRIGAPPSLACPPPTIVAAGADCMAPVPNVLPGVVVTDHTAPATGITLTQSPPSGTMVGIGTHAITVTGTDAAGHTVTCATSITVADQSAPVIVGVVPSSDTLWPPSQQMVPVTLSVNVADNCDTAMHCEIISVASSEPVTSLYDTTSPDWQITGDISLQLRAERLTSGPGRIYTITVRCTDASGNSSTKNAKVTVPHDQKSKSKGEL